VYVWYATVRGVLRSLDEWIWDSWVADDGERYHLFFLKAPRALEDPALRHAAARIGHASSVDLVEWEVHPDALGPRSERGFDDLALWTGSVARGDDGVWRMYYTAINREGRDLRDQRIGLAESDDLMTWRRVADEPLVEPDPCWYRMLGDGSGASETWRDPFVFRDADADADGAGWHMLITARDPTAERRFDGVLAHARSTDMRTWELAPPLTEAAGFGQLEVSQVRQIDGQWLLVFTCHPDEQGEPRPFCTWYVLGDSALGPWDVTQAKPFEDEPDLFAAPLIQRRDGSWAFVGFLDGKAFEIVDPIPVSLTEGTLRRSGPPP
jgi:beta-fructofuranosidase